MYLMFGFTPSDFTDLPSDVEFTQRLLAEENVLMLPGAVRMNLVHGRCVSIRVDCVSV